MGGAFGTDVEWVYAAVPTEEAEKATPGRLWAAAGGSPRQTSVDGLLMVEVPAEAAVLAVFDRERRLGGFTVVPAEVVVQQIVIEPQSSWELDVAEGRGPLQRDLSFLVEARAAAGGWSSVGLETLEAGESMLSVCIPKRLVIAGRLRARAVGLMPDYQACLLEGGAAATQIPAGVPDVCFLEVRGDAGVAGEHFNLSVPGGRQSGVLSADLTPAVIAVPTSQDLLLELEHGGWIECASASEWGEVLTIDVAKSVAGRPVDVLTLAIRTASGVMLEETVVELRETSAISALSRGRAIEAKVRTDASGRVELQCSGPAGFAVPPRQLEVFVPQLQLRVSWDYVGGLDDGLIAVVELPAATVLAEGQVFGVGGGLAGGAIVTVIEVVPIDVGDADGGFGAALSASILRERSLGQSVECDEDGRFCLYVEGKLPRTCTLYARQDGAASVVRIVGGERGVEVFLQDEALELDVRVPHEDVWSVVGLSQRGVSLLPTGSGARSDTVRRFVAAPGANLEGLVEVELEGLGVRECPVLVAGSATIGL
ncbi:hypothetical protein [Planctomycetes bacterium Pla163]|uniref:hypothetical protein n=1 Tax=Rohdeia mirabilis TaxID=2528008 RepID=UPI00119EBCB0